MATWALALTLATLQALLPLAACQTAASVSEQDGWHAINLLGPEGLRLHPDADFGSPDAECSEAQAIGATFPGFVLPGRAQALLNGVTVTAALTLGTLSVSGPLFALNSMQFSLTVSPQSDAAHAGEFAHRARHSCSRPR